MNDVLRRLGLGIGTVVFWCAWPAFWVYFRRSYGRTRIVLERDGKLLAAHNWISDGRWILPGGGLHKDEPLVQGALRELREETGVVLPATALRHLGSAHYHAYGFDFDYHIFGAHIQTVELQRQRHEVAELCWLEPRAFTPQNTNQDSLNAIRVATASGFLLQ